MSAKKLSLEATLKLLTPFLATDKKPEDVKAALMAAADAMPENLAKSEAVKDKRAADRKARDEKKAADRAARDAKFGEDASDPENTNDAEVMKACDKDMDEEAKDEEKAEDAAEQPPAETGTPAKTGKSEPGTMDSAGVAKVVADAVAAEREAGKALRVALDKVAPVLGKVTFDSAPEAYRAALTKLAVDHKGVADAALPSLLDAATRAPAPAAPLAQDADSTAALAKLIPNLNRLS